MPVQSTDRSATDVLTVLKEALKRRDRHFVVSAAEHGVDRYKGPDTTGRGSVDIIRPGRPYLDTLCERPIGVASVK